MAVVGKGLTFDSGGYNLKAGAGSMIEMMKFDMGGAGATLGAARILAQLQVCGPSGGGGQGVAAGVTPPPPLHPSCRRKHLGSSAA